MPVLYMEIISTEVTHICAKRGSDPEWYFQDEQTPVHRSILTAPTLLQVSFSSRKLSVSTVHCPFDQIYTALFIIEDLENFLVL